MFSAFSAFISETSEMVSELVQQSAEALQEVAPLDEMVGGTTEDAALTTQLITMKELHDAPPAWEATTEEWLTMMLAALQCTYWCSTTSTTLVGDERSWHDICDVLQLTEEERSTHEALATHLFSPDASLSGYMQEQDGIHRMYSLVVPLVLTSDAFWCSLGWKLGLARCCRKVEQVLLLWRAMSHSDVGADLQQDEKLQERWEEEGGSAEAYWAAVEDRWAEQRAHRQWLVEEEARVRKEVDVAMASVELLRNLLTKKEPAHSSLSESVSESCRYHKVKLSRLLAHLCTETERLQGTTLDQHSGALFASTMACSNDLKTVIDAFDARLAGKEELEEELVPELSTSRGPSAELAEDHDAANEAEAEEEEERDAHDADVEAHEDGAPNTRDDDEEEEFSVKLPWADE